MSTQTADTTVTEFDRGYRDGLAGRYNAVLAVTLDYQRGFKAGWAKR